MDRTDRCGQSQGSATRSTRSRGPGRGLESIESPDGSSIHQFFSKMGRIRPHPRQVSKLLFFRSFARSLLRSFGARVSSSLCFVCWSFVFFLLVGEICVLQSSTPHECSPKDECAQSQKRRPLLRMGRVRTPLGRPETVSGRPGATVQFEGHSSRPDASPDRATNGGLQG
jgi:hypothetical protein